MNANFPPGKFHRFNSRVGLYAATEKRGKQFRRMAPDRAHPDNDNALGEWGF
jgi:hypothetical protein